MNSCSCVGHKGDTMDSLTRYKKRSRKPTKNEKIIIGLIVFIVLYLYYMDVPFWVPTLVGFAVYGVQLIMVVRHYIDNVDITLEYIAIGEDIIPWVYIDHITMRRSELGNRYIAFYFRDDTPPKGFDIERFTNKEEIIRKLKEKAAVNHFGFIDES